MVNVTVSSLAALGVSERTAQRWISLAAAKGSWPVERIPTATKPARALVMPVEAFEALVATLRGAT